MLKKAIFLLLGLAVCIALLSGAALYWAVQKVEQIPLTTEGGLMQVLPGSSVQSLCKQWQQQGMLAEYDCQLLKIYSRFYPETGRVQQGYYRVPAQPLLTEVLALFRSGKVAQFSVTFIEGETLEQALQRLATAEYLQQDLPPSEHLNQLLNWPVEWGDTPELAEGLLYPDTYFYTANSKASDIVKRAQQGLVRHLMAAWQQRDVDLPVTHPYQLLILASIIEKESHYVPEKPQISSVFANRLRKNMRLQTDPTVIYGLDDFNGNITRADLRNPHPYNTYRHHGLPPGPIALVSRTSLQAAAMPAVTDYYYFVSKGDGSHVFSETLEQHNAAVRRYILGQE